MYWRITYMTNIHFTNFWTINISMLINQSNTGKKEKPEITFVDINVYDIPNINIGAHFE